MIITTVTIIIFVDLLKLKMIIWSAHCLASDLASISPLHFYGRISRSVERILSFKVILLFLFWLSIHLLLISYQATTVPLKAVLSLVTQHSCPLLNGEEYCTTRLRYQWFSKQDWECLWRRLSVAQHSQELAAEVSSGSIWMVNLWFIQW